MKKPISFSFSPWGPILLTYPIERHGDDGKSSFFFFNLLKGTYKRPWCEPVQSWNFTVKKLHLGVSKLDIPKNIRVATVTAIIYTSGRACTRHPVSIRPSTGDPTEKNNGQSSFIFLYLICSFIIQGVRLLEGLKLSSQCRLLRCYYGQRDASNHEETVKMCGRPSVPLHDANMGHFPSKLM